MTCRKPFSAALRHLGPGIRRGERIVGWLTALLLLATPAHAAPVAVAIQDKGVATRCAEQDNVYAAIAAPAVRSFQVTARQPAYGKDLTDNNYAADFTDCPSTPSHDYPFAPRAPVILYEDAKVKIVGVTYRAYWRPERVAVVVAGRRDRGFHLIQLFIKHGPDVQEALVLHAADGYWRLRPLPLPQFGGSVYGSSFLIGPLEEKTGEETSRPFVRIREITVDPVRMRFRLAFVKGGSATLRVTRIDHDQLTAAVTLTPVAHGPFLALRSMDVAPDNADTAQLQWPGHAAPAVGFGHATAAAFAFTRPQPSRHNSAAPDLFFDDFRN